MRTRDRIRTYGQAAFLLATLSSPPGSATTNSAMPELRNSPRLVTPDRVKVSAFSGTAGYSYRIEVPPGTGGMAPDLVLAYSTATRGSEYGFGWSMNLPFIERSTRIYRPLYHDPGVDGGDEFELEGDLLVRDGSDTSRFHLRQADGSQIRWISTGTPHWEVTKPDGTRLLFGKTADSRIFRNADSVDETFRWSLCEVIDPRGGSYAVTYREDWDATADGLAYKTYVYPETIRYTLHPSASGLATRRLIQFDWEERANPGESIDDNGICDGKEDCPTSFRGGFKLQRRFRLSRIGVGIDTSADGALEAGEEVRSYAFLYTNKTSNETPKDPPFSQLRAIQRYGSDGSAFRTDPAPDSAPVATEFSYMRPERKFKDADLAWSATSSVTPKELVKRRTGTNEEGWAVYADVATVTDMTGDGIPDRVETVKLSGTNRYKWFVHPGRASSNPTDPGVTPFSWTQSGA